MLAFRFSYTYCMCMELTYILDFDSTLVAVESLDELARLALKNNPEGEKRLAELHELTTQGMNGSLSFDEALKRRLDLFSANRTHVDELVTLLKDAITDSALELEDWFDENADNIYVVSGGFEDYIIPVVAELGIAPSHVFANKFVYDDDGMIIGFDASRHVSKNQGKANQVAQLQLASPIVAIGDGITDYEIRAQGEADEFWAFTQHIARPVVVERADRVLESFEDIEQLARSIA